MLADGKYNFSDAEMKRLTEWINNGEKCAIDGAEYLLTEKKVSPLNPYASDEEKQAAEN